MNGDRFKTGEREKKNRFRLEELKAPVVLPAGEDLSFSGVSASFQDGVWRLLAEVRKRKGEKGFLETASRDLIFWTKAEQAGEGKPEDDGEGCILYSAAEAERLLKNRPKHLDGRILGPASVIRHEESGLYMMFYCAADASGDAAEGGLAGASSDPEDLAGVPGEEPGTGGSVGLAVSRDLKHWQTFCRDRATYPDHGVIYDGDYYRAIPVSEYLSAEPLPTQESGGRRIFDIRDYGAVGDGATLCTEAFQAAIEALEGNGGGILLVAGGLYCTGTVKLPDRCTLWIDRDSAICASKNLDSYEDALVSCTGGRDIAIKGGGRIIGNGEYFVYLPLKTPLTAPLEETFLPPYLYDAMGYPVNTIRYAYRSRIRYAEDRYQEGLPPIRRPMYTVWIRGCENVEISNIMIEDALDWTLVLDCSSQVKVEDVVINGNRHVANTDGIDIMGCSQVEIRHCFVSCADDGICVKSPRRQGHDGINVADAHVPMRDTRDVHISDCTVMSVMNCFKIGTETYFDIENITVENCRFLLPDIFPGAVSGISIESADGSNIRNVTVRGIEMDRVCCPVFICLNMRNKFGFDGPEDEERRRFGGSIRNISISDIRALNVEVPSIITGFAAKGEKVVRRVENIRIRNFKAAYRDNREVLNLKEKVHENLTDYPENNAFGDVPAYGFYIRHAADALLENVEVIPRTMNRRPCILREDA